MPRSYAHEYLPLWYNALDEEIGLCIRTNMRKQLTAILYEARQEVNDPTLEEIMVLQIAEDTLFLIKRSTELDDA